ncbi:MAG: hypothetical protein ACR2PS_08745 [Pseudomonadales bacterium]
MATRYVLVTLSLLGVFFLNSVHAEPIGYFQRHGDRFTVQDQKSIWSADRRTVTVYMLGCDYHERMLENWSVREGYLRCLNEPDMDYDDHAEAILTFVLSMGGELKRLTLEASGISDDAPFGLTQVERSWTEDFPVSNLRVSEDNELLFKGVFEKDGDGLIGMVRQK